MVQNVGVECVAIVELPSPERLIGRFSEHATMDVGDKLGKGRVP